MGIYQISKPPPKKDYNLTSCNVKIHRRYYCFTIHPNGEKNLSNETRKSASSKADLSKPIDFVVFDQGRDVNEERVAFRKRIRPARLMGARKRPRDLSLSLSLFFYLLLVLTDCREQKRRTFTSVRSSSVLKYIP